ncbi:hypothetical protein Tco_0908298 [Tanacetum coccineum]|uniref:Uncharacterized protein n=1 Tax=Tanacetum coccineum TaxID=301880 RepID=A0ABQ5CNW0_9ASTR
METKVETCSVESEIEMKELFIENDLLLEHINCQDVMCIVMHADFENNRVLHANEDNLEYAQMEQSYIYEYSRCVELEVKLSKTKDIVEKDVYNELSERSLRLDQHWMYKLDLKPLSPKLRKNREVHVDYLKQAKEYADTLRDIVEQARAQQPLDSALDYACKFTTCIQELLVYVNATCPSSLNMYEKLVAITPLNKSKKVRFIEPIESTNNTPKQADSQNSKITNKPLLTSTGVYISTHASGSKPKGNTRNNRISRTSSSNQKNKKVEDQPKNAKTGLNKKNHISNYNASTKHAVLNVNSEFGFAAALAILITRASQSRQHDTLVMLPMDIKIENHLRTTHRTTTVGDEDTRRPKTWELERRGVRSEPIQINFSEGHRVLWVRCAQVSRGRQGRAVKALCCSVPVIEEVSNRVFEREREKVMAAYLGHEFARILLPPNNSEATRDAALHSHTRAVRHTTSHMAEKCIEHRIMSGVGLLERDSVTRVGAYRRSSLWSVGGEECLDTRVRCPLMVTQWARDGGLRCTVGQIFQALLLTSADHLLYVYVGGVGIERRSCLCAVDRSSESNILLYAVFMSEV